MQIKETQKTISGDKAEEVTEEEFYSILKLVSPGTNLRKALDGILHYGKGALIAIDNDFLTPILDGGFKVNCRFSPQRLIELSKMDGAIIISKDLKKIKLANVTLVPTSKINTYETGTRHKAAHRTAKQTSGLAIAISEKKKEITLFYKNKRYPIKDLTEMKRKVNEYIQILERQREIFDSYLETLNRLELRSYINLGHAIKTIQKGKVIQKISKELSKNLIELGDEGALLKTRIKEIMFDVEEETNLIIKDYSKIDDKRVIEILEDLSYEELLDKKRILQALDYENIREVVRVDGWRILSKTTLTESEMAKLVKELGGFDKIIETNIDYESEAISKDKFSLLKVELERMKVGL